jgi:hypothetical protein
MIKTTWFVCLLLLLWFLVGALSGHFVTLGGRAVAFLPIVLVVAAVFWGLRNPKAFFVAVITIIAIIIGFLLGMALSG